VLVRETAAAFACAAGGVAEVAANVARRAEVGAAGACATAAVPTVETCGARPTEAATPEVKLSAASCTGADATGVVAGAADVPSGSVWLDDC